MNSCSITLNTIVIKSVFQFALKLIFGGLILSFSAYSVEIEEVIVTSDFRASKLSESASSVTVINSKTIAQRQAKHLEQLLNLAPNVNFSSGASRGRFIQIRGIGERSQFIEPLNPSVGLLIDGIDFTGIAGAATTMDIDQVEIMRGPQGTIFGANALAGLINLTSNQPTESTEGKINIVIGNNSSKTVSGALGGAVIEDINFRLAAQSHKSDGYIINNFLQRDDTDNIDELSLRSIFDWEVNSDLKLKLTLFHVDADNGYDAFSLDNTRQTLSDTPGHDRQKSSAVAVNSYWTANDKFDFMGLINVVNSNLEYGYDEDWAFPDICAGQECNGWEYNSKDNYLRDRENSTIDVRLVSNQSIVVLGTPVDWVIGMYSRAQDENLLRQYTYNSDDFTSYFDTRNHAAYGQLDTHISTNINLLTGIRFETRKADYEDSDNVNHKVSESLWGGSISLKYKLSDVRMVYGLISRGYKAGGVNSEPALSSQDREFDTELMWNFETGVKGSWLDDSLDMQISLFYQKRQDIQIKQSLVQSREDSNASDFTDYFGNSAKGSNYGLEVELNWIVSDRLSLFGSFGRLQTDFDTPLSFALNSRDQAHAPSYQFTVGSTLQVTPDIVWVLGAEGKDKFYLSSSHDEQSKSYKLLTSSLTYTNRQWTISLWGRNLLDEDVIVRGFGGFGNDPRKYYAVEPYYQYGEPRAFGLSTEYSF